MPAIGLSPPNFGHRAACKVQVQPPMAIALTTPRAVRTRLNGMAPQQQGLGPDQQLLVHRAIATERADAASKRNERASASFSQARTHAARA